MSIRNPFLDRHKIGMDSILLFILVFLFLTNLETNKSFFFLSVTGIISIYYIISLLLIIAYVFIDFKMEKEIGYYSKLIIILFMIIFLIGSTVFSQIYLRHKADSNIFIHDGVVQTEEAIKFLIQGKNPYTEDYINTPFGDFVNTFAYRERPNPAWYHYVYLPFHLLFSAPFYLLFEKAVHFYDERIVYFLLFCLSIWIIYKLADKKNNKLIAVILFVFNPIFIFGFIKGYNDIFVFFFIILSIYLLKIKKIGWSSLALALACASKQSAWLILPFYLTYIYFQEKKVGLKEKLFGTFKKLTPFIVTVLLIFIPFLVWGINGFIDDVFRYPTGTIETKYPISGIGFSQIVPMAGWVKSIWDYYPFWIWQMIFCLPLLYFLIKWQRKNNRLPAVLINFVLFAFIFWFFSQFFYANYISFLSIILIAAYAINDNDEEQVNP
jgi:hypothetical protein